MKTALANLLGLATLLLAGCGGKDAEAAKNDLMDVGLNYVNYSDQNGKGPSKPEDIKSTLHPDAAERVMKKLNSGEIVVIWDVDVMAAVKAPGADPRTVLAYEKDAPTKGGFVFMLNLNAEKVTADEFKKMKMVSKSTK